MTNQQLLASRYLLADWFSRFAEEEGISFPQNGESGSSLTFGSPAGREVSAHFTQSPPFLDFVANDGADQGRVSGLAARAAAKAAAWQLGSEVWYSFELREPPLSLISPHGLIGGLMLRLGSQTRITGWRRLGGSVLLEFSEGQSTEANPENPLLAPPAIVNVHVAAPGPIAGRFSSYVAHSVVEPVAAICGFALGRAVDPPPVLFPAERVNADEFAAKRSDPSILTLARKGVSLDLFSLLAVDGGLECAARARSALITFDAGMRQERDSVASILYVVAAESLSVPTAKWSHERLTARFVDFYVRELAKDLDAIVGHGNFEEAFGIFRASKGAESLRKKLLKKIYGIRSQQVHEGLLPTYRGFGLPDDSVGLQRGLIHDFAEAAVLNYLGSPRSSLIGHPQLWSDQASTKRDRTS